MTIANLRDRCKALSALTRSTVKQMPRDLLVISILTGSCLASFGLGYLAGRDVGQGSDLSFTPSTTPSGAKGEVVASKGGTRYYLPGCSGAARIADDKKVWFASADLARAEGYEPAENCEGL